MGNNKKRIQTIYKLNDEVQALIEKESDAYKKATANRENKVTIKREDKDVEVTEAILWEEIRVAGTECESGKLLGDKYPDLFKIATKREEKNTELHTFIKKEFGFDFRQMGVAEYLKLTEAVIDYKLSEK